MIGSNCSVRTKTTKTMKTRPLCAESLSSPLFSWHLAPQVRSFVSFDYFPLQAVCFFQIPP
jgi:hypothetical protein